MSLFRPTAKGFGRKLCYLVALCLGLLGIFTSQALASSRHHGHWYHPKPAPEQVSEELAVCEGQLFSQPFLSYGDANYYTLVDGSEFEEGREGWSLRGGAEVVDAIDPDGAAGGALQLPPGSVAVSPPVCVTLQYPSARTWVRGVVGSGGLSVGVFYAGSKYGSAAAEWVARVDPPGSGWALSEPFAVKPELGGSQEGTREVRFVFSNSTASGVFQLSDLYVDPRMR